MELPNGLTGPFVLFITITVLPNDVDPFVEVLRNAKKTAPEEDGMLAWRASRDLRQDGVFHMFESWSGPTAFAAHADAPAPNLILGCGLIKKFEAQIASEI